MTFSMKVLQLVRYTEAADPSAVDVEGTIIMAKGKYKADAEVTVEQPITPELHPTIMVTLVPDEAGSHIIKFEKSNIGYRLFEEEDESICNVTITILGRSGTPQPSPAPISVNKKRRKRPM